MTLEQFIGGEQMQGGKCGAFGFAGAAELGAGGNGGLWFDRIGAPWTCRKKKNRWELELRQASWISGLLDLHNGGRTDDGSCLVGDPGELPRFADRTLELVKAMRGYKRDFVTAGWSKFVTGVGIGHPIENGFAWHRTLGVPYMPGSSVKGLALAWARDWEKEKDALWRIFGPEPEAMEKQPKNAKMGSVVFLDAVPIEPPRLSIEILTPHGPGSGAPIEAGKTSEPKPIAFLAVKQAEMRFAVLPATSVNFWMPQTNNARARPNDQTRKDMILVLGWLEQALATVGAGAKTKSGYGRFKPTPQDATKGLNSKPEASTS